MCVCCWEVRVQPDNSFLVSVEAFLQINWVCDFVDATHPTPPPPKKKSQVNLNNWDDHTFSIWLIVVFMFFMFLSVLFGAVVSTIAISAMEVKCQKPRGCLLVKCTASWLARWLHNLRFLIPIVQDLLDRNDQTSTYGWDIQELNC